MIIKLSILGIRNTWRKKPSQQGENQQQTQPTYGTRPGWNQAQAILVGVEHTHHCANPVADI